jgi:hypothetical protein
MRGMIEKLRAAGVVKKERPPPNVGRCIEHLDDLLPDLGFTSIFGLVGYIESLATRGRKRKTRVTLDRTKCPPGVVRVEAIACRCTGGCATCSGLRWGLRLYTSRREHRCDAPTTGQATAAVPLNNRE